MIVVSVIVIAISMFVIVIPKKMLLRTGTLGDWTLSGCALNASAGSRSENNWGIDGLPKARPIRCTEKYGRLSFVRPKLVNNLYFGETSF